MSSPDQPNRGSGQPPSEGDEPTRGKPASTSEFGSFVSSSVKNSFRQLKRESELARRSESTESPATSEASSRFRRRRSDQPTEQDPPVRSGPVGRKWRDAIAPSQSQSSSEHASEYEGDEDSESGEPRFDLGGWFRETFFDENGPTRKLFAAIALLILAILIIIYVIAQGGDDDGGNDDPTQTPTSTNVISADRTGTPADNDQETPTGQSNRQTPEVTPTEGIQVGGDNQKD